MKYFTVMEWSDSNFILVAKSVFYECLVICHELLFLFLLYDNILSCSYYIYVRLICEMFIVSTTLIAINAVSIMLIIVGIFL